MQLLSINEQKRDSVTSSFSFFSVISAPKIHTEFTDRFRLLFKTVYIYIYIYISLHYLVKYLCSKNRNTQEVIEANCHVKLRPLKKLLKYLSSKIFLS